MLLAIPGAEINAGAAGRGGQGSAVSRNIVFVCEHGAAKSVIATAYFNKLAAERGLPYRAIFRGTDPQPALSVKVVEGLRADGVALPSGTPAPLADGDLEHAMYVFAIGCTLPAQARRTGKARDWSDVPEVSDGYAASRDAIVKHVTALVDELQQRRK
jgi:protein-tyrosine-phosphatase